MNTLDIEIAIMQKLDVRANLIVTGVHWGLFLGNNYMHECDVLSLSKSGYATEIEIKISKADLLKDKDKKHGHNHDYIKYLYFAVPEFLKEAALSEIPERAGLYIIRHVNNRNRVYQVKEAKVNKEAVKWTNENRLDLARLGAMRILGLKQKITEITLSKEQINNK